MVTLVNVAAVATVDSLPLAAGHKQPRDSSRDPRDTEASPGGTAVTSFPSRLEAVRGEFAWWWGS
jgi:hypothetical protein